MKLKYIETPNSESGGALPGCGTIHITEVKCTLAKLSGDLQFPLDLNDYILGSTGKSEYSGDIDLVIDNKWWQGGPSSLRQTLEALFGIENVARNGDMIHLKYPIVNYKEALRERGPRNGYVQIDFNLGDPAWERFYHFSPGDMSSYKGAHRNLAIAAVTAVVSVVKSAETDTQGRPTETIRWIFGSAGFKMVARRSVKASRTGDWKRKQDDEILAGPHFATETIAQLLFQDERARSEDLFSLETMMAAVKRYCGLVEQERIWQRMAHNFTDWKDGRNFIYPDEIAAYISGK